MVAPLGLPLLSLDQRRVDVEGVGGDPIAAEEAGGQDIPHLAEPLQAGLAGGGVTHASQPVAHGIGLGERRVVEQRQPRGFAFIEMVTDAEAQNAIKMLNEHPIGGRALAVNEARPKPERSGGFGGGGDYGGGGDSRRRRSEPRW